MEIQKPRILITLPNGVFVASKVAEQIEQILYRHVVEHVLPSIQGRYVDPTDVRVSIEIPTIDTDENGRQVTLYRLRSET